MNADEAQLYDMWLKGKDPSDSRGFEKWCRDNGIISHARRKVLEFREGLCLVVLEDGNREAVVSKVGGDQEDIRSTRTIERLSGG
jgi:hypothetical protein